jgi:hypothetical protein
MTREPCGVTTTIKTAPFRGSTLFFLCDREADHKGQHHGRQPDGSSAFWGLSDDHEPGDLHTYEIRCSTCGQQGSVVLTVEPQIVPDRP